MISLGIRCSVAGRRHFRRFHFLLRGSMPRYRGLSTTSCSSNIVQDPSDRCNKHVLSSPFPPIDPGPYPPLYEFVTRHWQQHGGTRVGANKTAIVDGTTGMTRTFGDYYTTSTGLAGALTTDLSVQPHTTVALYCPNHVDYAPIVLGISLCGAKVTPVNPLYTKEELCIVLDRSQSTVLMAHRSTLAVALEAAHQSSTVQHVIVITDDDDGDSGKPIPEGTIHLNTLRHHDSAFDQTVDETQRNTDTHPVCLPYSSGTTGLPKGVCLTHRNLVANLLQTEQTEGPHFLPHHTLMSPLPFFHIYAFTVSLLYPAWQCQTVITTSGRFDLEEYCRLVQEHRPERSHLVPPILLGLAQHPVVDKYDLSSLRTIVSAAAPLSVETEHAVQTRLGKNRHQHDNTNDNGNLSDSSSMTTCRSDEDDGYGIVVKQAWGMSELSPLGTINPDVGARSGSVGPVCASTRAKIVNEDGDSLPPHQSGELLIQGPQVMLGYLHDPDQTNATISSEQAWLRTGDVAEYDDDGYVYITDRRKELIKVRGYPVAPAELEALLLTHSDVTDAAVIAVPDAASGEVPRAYVVVSPCGNDDDTDNWTDLMVGLGDWIHERVAPYKRLDGGIVVVESIPKSASGKILRRILRDHAHEDTTVYYATKKTTKEHRIE